MKFDLLEPTKIKIDGKFHLVQMYNGCTGIGSRDFWIDGKKYDYGCVRHTADITKGNHALYRMRWRDQPWDIVYIFISKKYEKLLLSKDNEWRRPQKVSLNSLPQERGGREVIPTNIDLEKEIESAWNKLSQTENESYTKGWFAGVTWGIHNTLKKLSPHPKKEEGNE